MRLDYVYGIYPQIGTLIIPRLKDGYGKGVGPVYGAVMPSFPGGYIQGSHKFLTVLDFAPTVLDYYIKTENFNNGTVLANWNDGDPNTITCVGLRNLTVNGPAQILPNAWGTSYTPIATGVALQGSSFDVNGVRLTYIPGTGLILKDATNNATSKYGIFDNALSKVNDLFVHSVYKGVQQELSGAYYHDLEIGNCITDAFVGTASCNLDQFSVNGADRGIVLASKCSISNGRVYARIGLYCGSGSNQSRISGLDIGDSWYRGVKIDSNYNLVDGLTGIVRNTDSTYTDVSGLELNGAGNFVEATLTLKSGQSNTNQSRLVTLGGSKQTVNLTGGWSTSYPQATAIQLSGNITGSHIRANLSCNGGYALDLSATTLDVTDGLGNVFDLTGVTVDQIKWPSSSTVPNLGEGNTLLIDGKLIQSHPDVW